MSWFKKSPFEQNMKAWELTNTLLLLTQLRDQAPLAERKKYSILIDKCQNQLIKAQP